MLVDETDDRFYVAESTLPEAGNGLFAKVALNEGDRFEVIGALVLRESISDLCSHYADEHKFRVGDYLLIPLGFCAMANHSANPNLEKVFEGEDRVFLRALRRIEPGEELFFTYTPYAQGRFGLE